MKRFILSFAILLGVFQLSFASPGTDLLEKGRKMYKACYLDVRNDFTKAEAVLEQAYEALMKENNSSDAAEAMYLIGDINMITGKDYVYAEKCFNKAIELAKDRKNKFYTLSNISLAKQWCAYSDIINVSEKVDYYITNQLCDDWYEYFDTLHELVRAASDIGIAMKRAGTVTMALGFFEGFGDIPFDQKDTLGLLEKISCLSEYALLLVENGHSYALPIISSLMADFKKLNCRASVVAPLFLANYGKCHFFMGKYYCETEIDKESEYKVALECLEEAKELYYNNYGLACPDGIRTECAIGEVYLTQGKYQMALSIFESVKQKALEHTRLAITEKATYLSWYAKALLMLGKTEEAWNVANEADKMSWSVGCINEIAVEVIGEISLGKLVNNISLACADALYIQLLELFGVRLVEMIKIEREFFWRCEGWNRINTITRLATNYYQDINGTLYNVALLSKYQLLGFQESVEETVKEFKSPELNRKIEELKKLQLKNIRTDVLIGERADLIYKMRTLEKEIQEAGQLGTKISDCIKFSYSQIAACLSPNEAAIEFVSYVNPDGKKNYAVSILRSGQVPQNISLGIDDTYTEYCSRDFIYNHEDYLLFNQLLFYLKGVDTIYFSPTGIYSSVAIENLLMPDGKRLSERFNMIRLSSTREILRLKQEKPAKWTSAVLYGGLNYNTSAENKEYYAEQATSRGISDEQHWGYLPGTLNEVSSIKNLFKDIPCEVYTDDAGVEETFKALSGKAPSVIHIATHGAYDKDLVNKSMSSFWVEENDMLNKCYLVFSGANTPLPGRDDLDDGMLTALEISQMDLRGTDLVVLSACGTGLNIRNYNESYGLLQGFKKAGCKSVLMTLWDVDDAVTELFMTNFYRSRLSGLDNHSSLEKAKAAVRVAYPDPKYWAGFILID